jgi:anti-sigma regulatory factor (Ser/Thr protein kinase)
MADTARALSRGLILLSAALRRVTSVLGLVERLDLTLPARPSSLHKARRSLRRLSRAAGLDDDRTFALEVAVGEAINNVIEHAYGPAGGIVQVCAWRDGDAIVVEVRDHGRWRSDRPDGAQRGRGIRLMQGLADSVDFRRAPEGTTVRLAVSSRASSAGVPLMEAGHGPPQ